MKNLKTEWIEDFSLNDIQAKVNKFTQSDKIVVRATQTHALEMGGRIYYIAVVFYEG
jgi:hypothetical protein